MASNPAFNRIEKDAQSGYAGFGGTAQAQTSANPYTGGANPYGAGVPSRALEEMYNAPSATAVETGRVTMDDVIMKALMLFGIVLVTGAGGWVLSTVNPGLGFMAMIAGMLVTFVLGLVIAFKKTLSVPLIIGYAAFEGLFLGTISQFFETMYQGIVAQAVLATVATFAGMFGAYKTGLIKVTSKFRRIVTMMLWGYLIFAVVNVIFAFVTKTPFGIGGTGWLGIGISLFAVGLAAVTLALDFDSIDYAIRTGAPQKYSWLLAHGLIVTLVWLYIEFLRLIARFRSN